jgi:hypothetical protein
MNDDWENNLRISLINKLWDEIKLFLRDSGFIQKIFKLTGSRPSSKRPSGGPVWTTPDRLGRLFQFRKVHRYSNDMGRRLIRGTLGAVYFII